MSPGSQLAEAERRHSPVPPGFAGPKIGAAHVESLRQRHEEKLRVTRALRFPTWNVSVCNRSSLSFMATNLSRWPEFGSRVLCPLDGNDGGALAASSRCLFLGRPLFWTVALLSVRGLVATVRGGFVVGAARG